jgi:RNA polymerase sigma factor (sigma-70 family)
MYKNTLEINVSSKNNHQIDGDNSGESILSTFKRYNSALNSFISGYLVNSQDIDDVCQETFLRTYKSSLENKILKPKPFMFRVIKGLIFSDFKKASNQLNDYVEDIDLGDSTLELDHLADNALAQKKLGIMCETIANLPNKCRQAVMMRKVYGLTTKDIAKQMNISTITASNYITTGMCAYNKALMQYNDENNKDSKEITAEEKLNKHLNAGILPLSEHRKYIAQNH